MKSPPTRYDKVLERTNVTIDKLPASGSALAMDRTYLAIATTKDDWSRKDYRAKADLTQPVLFTDVRLILIDDWGGFYYPLIGASLAHAL